MKFIYSIILLSLVVSSNANANGGHFSNLPTYTDSIDDLSVTLQGIDVLYEGGTLTNEQIVSEIKRVEARCKERLEIYKNEFITNMKTTYGTDVALIESICRSGVSTEESTATTTKIVTRVYFTFLTK